MLDIITYKGASFPGIHQVPNLHTVRLGAEEVSSAGGSPVLLLHGWGQNLECMRLLGDLLAKHYGVYLIDLPGFGKSERPETDWDTVEYATFMARFIEENNLGKVHLIGHSFGGRVGIRLACRYPDRVASLTLINSGGLKRVLKGKSLWRAKFIGWLGKAVKTADRTLGTKLFESWFAPKYGSRDYRNAGDLRNILVRTVNEDVTIDASKVPVRTFLLWGEKDDETPVEMGYRLTRLIPNSRLLVLPDKDHFPFIDEGAHLCAHYILDFLRQEPDPSHQAKKTGDLASV